MTDKGPFTYYFVGKGPTPSFDPEAADLIKNMIHMDHLVGTLLKEKYGNSGRTEPYLAERWTSSPDGLVWDFYLKQGLTCEDGSQIDAPRFVQSFNTILRLYSKRQDLAAFNRLRGWKTFIDGKGEVDGIRAITKSQLQFVFDTRPDGLPEFLSMAFYGFYCSSNFDNGKWRSVNNITASGGYTIVSESLKSDELLLKKRTDSSLMPADAPSLIRIRTITANDALKVKPKSAMIHYHQFAESDLPAGFQVYQGAPVFLTALVLSPFRKGPLNSVKNRKLFRDALHVAMTGAPLAAPYVFPSRSFYFDPKRGGNDQKLPTKVHDKVHDYGKNGTSKLIKILRFSYSSQNPARRYVEQVVVETLKQLGWAFEIVDPNFSDPAFIKNRNENSEYDIRFATVDIGGNAENWVINMMFCTKLGISFPDFSGNFKRLVDEHEGKSGLYDTGLYLRRFEEQVESDATVVPIFHSASIWLHSHDIMTDDVLTPTQVVPRLDKIKFK